MDFDRFTGTWDMTQPWTQQYRIENLRVDVADSLAVLRYHLGSRIP